MPLPVAEQPLSFMRSLKRYKHRSIACCPTRTNRSQMKRSLCQFRYTLLIWWALMMITSCWQMNADFSSMTAAARRSRLYWICSRWNVIISTPTASLPGSSWMVTSSISLMKQASNSVRVKKNLHPFRNLHISVICPCFLHRQHRKMQSPRTVSKN